MGGHRDVLQEPGALRRQPGEGLGVILGLTLTPTGFKEAVTLMYSRVSREGRLLSLPPKNREAL